MKIKLLILSLIIIVVVVVVVLAITFLRGDLEPPTETSTTFPYSSPAPVKPSSPMQATLTLLEKPLLETPVNLVLGFKSVMPASNTEVKIELPDSFVLVSGTPSWQGDLEANEEQKIDIVIKSTKVGYYQLKGSAISREGESYSFGNTAIIDIEITPDDAIAGSKPKNSWYEPAQVQLLPMSENNEQIQSELIISPNPALNKEFTITYRARSPINTSDLRSSVSLFFSPKAFEIINVQFPEGGKSSQSNSQAGWRGEIAKDQDLVIKATLKVINAGWGPVYGHLVIYSAEEEVIRDVKAADLYVDKYEGRIDLK